MVLKTERLTIRPFTPNDAGDLFEYLSNPEVALYEPYDTFTLEECRAEAARRSKDSSFWAVCLKDANKLIGNIYLAERDFDTWELGFVFNPKYQGKGYAAESASAVVDHAVNSLNARRIIAMCNPQNTRSWRLLERLGFRREGHLRQNIYFKTGADGKPIWLDTYEYGLLASEWRRPAGNHADKTEIAYLADHPEHIHTCASWAFGLWGCQSGKSFDHVLERFSAGANKRKLPITIIALCNSKPAGMASLWVSDATGTDLTPWLAAVYVHPFYRNRRISFALIGRAVEEARRLGFSELYLVTETAAGLYSRFGWSEIGKTKSPYGEAVLMRKLLGQ